MLTISADRLLIRKSFKEIGLDYTCKSQSQVRNEKNLENREPSGIVTRKVKKRMTVLLSNWLQALNIAPVMRNGYKKYMPTFVTLTLPAEQMHSDKDLYKLALNRFIIKLQRRPHSVIHYFWRAERQDNGNIHYHLIVDKFIGWKCLRSYWNEILNDLGYIDAYRNNQKLFHSFGFKVRQDLIHKWSVEAQYNAYQEGIANNWSSPNSTDIHSLGNVENVVSYITKYMTKDEAYYNLNKRERAHEKKELSEEHFAFYKQLLEAEIERKKIKGRLWGHSDKLKNLKDCEMIFAWGGCTDSSVIDFVNDVSADKNSKIVTDDNFTLIYSKKILLFARRYPDIMKNLNLHKRNNYYHLYGHLLVKPPGLFDVSGNVNIDNVETVFKVVPSYSQCLIFS